MAFHPCPLVILDITNIHTEHHHSHLLIDFQTKEVVEAGEEEDTVMAYLLNRLDYLQLDTRGHWHPVKWSKLEIIQYA